LIRREVLNTHARADEGDPHPARLRPEDRGNGHVAQIDLSGGTRSGVYVVRDVLGDVDDVHDAELSSNVVPLPQWSSDQPAPL
jgi:hypothetical protein